MTPILNGNLSIHAIRLKLKKDPFPSKLCSHIPSKMDPSRPPGDIIDGHHITFIHLWTSLPRKLLELDNKLSFNGDLKKSYSKHSMNWILKMS